MISSVLELLHELTCPYELCFLDPGAANVSGKPAHVREGVTLLPWKPATSHCHMYVLIILTLENQLSAWQCWRTVMLC